MKVLFFSDTHGSDTYLDRIIHKAKNVDLVVCAGDFTVFENDITSIMKRLDDIGKPILIIHGNHETESTIINECKKLKNIVFIHKKYYIVNNIIFYGHGGGGFSVRDERFLHDAESFIVDIKKISVNPKIVLVTHAPSYGSAVDYIDFETGNVGNRSITEFIVKHEPFLAVSGHIHETAGAEDKLHKTKVINPGWEGMIIDL